MSNFTHFSAEAFERFFFLCRPREKEEKEILKIAFSKRRKKNSLEMCSGT
jgi:hypothetical protein